MTTHKEDLKKVELPRIWQVLQLWSLQSLAGSLISIAFLLNESVSKALIKAFGDKNYAIILAAFLIVGAVSCYGAGTKGVQLLLHVIRMTKAAKDE